MSRVKVRQPRMPGRTIRIFLSEDVGDDGIMNTMRRGGLYE